MPVEKAVPPLDAFQTALGRFSRGEFVRQRPKPGGPGADFLAEIRIIPEKRPGPRKIIA